LPRILITIQYLLTPVDVQSGKEKRNDPRFPWVVEIVAVVSSEFEAPEQSPLMLHGVTVNIAKGGIGIAGDRLLPPGAVVRCEVSTPDTPIRIPTLVMVRWSGEGDAKGQYRLGLQFLV
jgi:hypothetical protein